MSFLKRKYFILVGVVALLIVGVFLLQGEARGFSIDYRITPEMGEVVVVSFARDISAKEAKQAFHIEPAISGELVWIEDYRELHFVPEEGFDQVTSYTVTVYNATSPLASLHEPRTISFQPEGLPTKIHVRVRGEDTIYYITESGLKRPMSSVEVFNSYPTNNENNIWAVERDILDLYPDGTLIHLEEHSDVYRLEDGTKRLVQNLSTFNQLGLDWDAIAPVNYVEFSAYPTGEPIRIDSLPHQKAARGKFIEIDLANMQMKLWQDGRLTKVLEVAGKGNPRSTPTRTGLFSVLSKEKNHYSTLSHVWMPWSMRYSGGYFIHEWPYWPGGEKITAKYSAGCVRLNEGDSKYVYDWVDIGTPILVH